jgi:hypothetical protein
MSLKIDWEFVQKDIGNMGMGRVNNRNILDITDDLSKSLSLITDWCLEMETRMEVTANRN